MLFTLALILSTSMLAAAHPFLNRRVEEPGCSVKDAKLVLPTPQNALVVPTDQKPSQVLLGVGTQNYTCGDDGKFQFIGVKADLSDISCFVGKQGFDEIQDEAFDGKFRPSSATVVDLYFISDGAGGINEKFASACDGGASFVVVKKDKGVPAPNTAKDVDWVQLSSIEGDLAKTAFRVRTKGGQPPDSCTPGSDPIALRYTAQYWLFK